MRICFLGNIGPKAVRGVHTCIADANATRLSSRRVFRVVSRTSAGLNGILKTQLCIDLFPFIFLEVNLSQLNI